MILASKLHDIGRSFMSRGQDNQGQSPIEWLQRAYGIADSDSTEETSQCAKLKVSIPRYFVGKY
jgi:hypothetical protein